MDIIGSLVSPHQQGYATSTTVASFTAAMSISTVTKPALSTTRIIIDSSGSRAKESVTLKVMPYGGDANDNAINIKVQGWSKVQSQTGLPSIQYVSRFVAEVGATLSSSLLGIAGMPMVATEFCADSLSWTAGVAILHIGTANIDAAWFEVDVSSYEIVEILCNKGTGARANCFYGW